MVSNFGVQFRAAFFVILSKGESEKVFTTCIYNNIANEYKMPHIITINLSNLDLIFLEFMIKRNHELDEKWTYNS